jgi:hypothetical protein
VLPFGRKLEQVGAHQFIDQCNGTIVPIYFRAPEKVGNLFIVGGCSNIAQFLGKVGFL